MPRRSFTNDYGEGAHPTILHALCEGNQLQEAGYGHDHYSSNAKDLIRQTVGASDDDDAAVFFVTGGTAANILGIASCLRPHEAVIGATTSHIAIHEAGAIEATGHKILLVAAADGKVTVDGIRQAVKQNSMFPHQTKARMVYISNSTEIGTIYMKRELSDLAKVCHELGLLLFMDGARLGAAMTATKNDLTLNDVYHLTDIFWIGGTKTGALLGEAVVIKNKAVANEFPFHMKQRGQLLAKGRVLGIQFTKLFQDGLFFSLARHANAMALQLSTRLVQLGIKLRAETETNQVFPILSAALLKTLQQEFEFHVWESISDDAAVVRLVTSWATQKEHVELLCTAVEGWVKSSAHTQC